MSYTIAVAGKGGTGKTTLAALIVDFLAHSDNHSVLAVDADPNSNLGEFLGLGVTSTLVGILDDIALNKENIPAGMTKERLIEYKVQGSIVEAECFDLLVMGRPEGPGCYCYPNSILREILNSINKGYKFTIIDNEAGMEHLSRRIARTINYFFIISDPTEPGLRASKRILDLIKELKISVGKIHLIINKVESDAKTLQHQINQLSVDYIDYLPESDDIFNLSKVGRPVTEIDKDSEFIKKLNSVLEKAKTRWH